VIALLPLAIAGAGHLDATWGALIAGSAVQVVASLVLVRAAAPTLAAVVVAATVVALIAAADVLYPVNWATAPWIGVAGVTAGYRLMAGQPGVWALRAGYLALAGAAVVALRPWQGSWSAVAEGLALFAAPVLAGLWISIRRRLVRQLRAGAESAEREQHLLAERARADERARLAEEMRDVVTHRVSLMVLQAGALRMTAADPVTRVAADELRVAGVQALDELRDLTGELRRPGAAGAPGGPRPPDLRALVDRSVSAGLSVRLDISGDPEGVAPVVARTLHRIVREALTNVGKHAPEAAAEVWVRYGGEGVHVSVTNEAPVPVIVLGVQPATIATTPVSLDPDLAASGSRQGLANLARRVELMRGSFQAGRRADGRFAVEARLPSYVPAGPTVPAPR
jgi:signal transduction histidine kinase